MKKIFFWLIILLAVFVPLYPKFPLENVEGTFVAIRLEDIFIAIIYGFWFLFNIKNLKNFLQKDITQAILLFWGIGFLSLLSAMLLTYSVTPHLGLLNWLRRIEYMGLFFVAATSIQNVKNLKTFLIVGLVTAVLVVLYGFGQYLGLPVISTTNSEYSKGLILHLNPGTEPNSTFAGHYDLAVYLNIVLIFLGAFIFQDRLSIKNWLSKIRQKLALVIPGLISAVLLGLTSERMSFLATILGLMSVFWMIGKKWLIVGVVLAGILVVGAVPSLRHRLVATLTVNVLNGGGAKYSLPPQPTFDPKAINNNQPASFSAERLNASSSATGSAKLPRDIAPGEPINTTELGIYRSFNIRTDVEWPRAIMAFEKNPILGTGYSSLTIATDNDILRSLGEVGLLGTLSFAFIIFIILKKLFIVFKKEKGLEKTFILATISSVGAFILTSTVIDVFEASKVAILFWILLGVAWAVANDYEL